MVHLNDKVIKLNLGSVKQTSNINFADEIEILAQYKLTLLLLLLRNCNRKANQG